MKEYRKIGDLPDDLIEEIEEAKSFFDDVAGKCLDEQQRIACVLNDCDLQIIAGAGTGKTQTLVAKSNYLIERKNVKPSEILCLSFSNASVEDLSARLKYPIETRTIHSLGLSIIRGRLERRVFDERGFSKLFKEYLGEASSKQLFEIQDFCLTYLAGPSVKAKLTEIETEREKLDYLVKNTYIERDLKQFITLFKSKDWDVNDMAGFKKACAKDLEASEYYFKNMEFLNIADSFLRHYQSYLSKNRLIDFNDMINMAISIIAEKGFDKNYRYIFVDEYQDMSVKNFQLLKALKEKTQANLVVVGDDWQSIYGFRDSDLKLFTDFGKYFPGAKRVYIEKTYRNPQQLIDAAGSFIMKDESHFKKALVSDTSIEKPIKIVYRAAEDDGHIIRNLISSLSEDNSVMMLSRYASLGLDEFLYQTGLVKKGRSRNCKRITDSEGNIENVEYRTIHNAKGLEADYVIIMQMTDAWLGFPNMLSPSYFMTFMHGWDITDKLSEERRLFYVALTRARKGVYIFTLPESESPYITELKSDSPGNLELIYTGDAATYAHLGEFGDVSQDEADLAGERAVRIKTMQKELGDRFMKSKDYDKAIDFYQKLITNMYYLNDCYPYRKLTEAYAKNNDFDGVIKTVGEFFKSGRYCDESEIVWFKSQFKIACKHTGDDFNAFDEYLEYFKNHSLKNGTVNNDSVAGDERIRIKLP